MASIEKRLLSIPFARGLSQREDERWLAPGSLTDAINATHLKSNVISKRPGSTRLVNVGLASVPGVSATRVTGKRLGQWNGQLAVIGADSFTDAVWSQDETAQKPVFKDRVPEVYALPTRTIAGGSGIVLDMDSCLCNGLLVHVWLFGLSSKQGAPAPGIDIYYQVENAQTGAIIIGARSIGVVPAAVGACAPKIVACGTVAILTFATGATGTPTSNDYTIYATALDCSSPNNSWVAINKVTSVPAPPFSLTSGATGTGSYIGVYDLDHVVGDTTTYVVGCATGSSSATQHITLFKCSVANTLSGTMTPTSGNINANDSVWTADGSTHQTLTGIAIRADSTNNEVLVAYGWGTNVLGGGTTRVSVQLVNYTALASVAIAVNLMATTGGSPNPSSSDISPLWIAVDRINSGGSIFYKTYFSPSSCFWDEGQGGGNGSATAYIASYVTQVAAGVMQVAAWQPRITYGVRLASRVVQRNGIGYLMGYLPSHTQGSYFLFADDAWLDMTTVNTKAFPMRLVGTFSPRLASGPALFFYRNQTINPSPPTLSMVLPHLVSNAAADNGNDVVYTLLTQTQGQLTVSEPAMMAWDFASPLSYQCSMLGENMGIACACPSAYDGTNVFELGFPYHPIVISVAEGTGSGSLNAGSTYNYLVTYEKRDSRGQKHRSPRSVAFTHTLGVGKTNLTLTVTTMGFSAREKANTPTAGLGPQGLTTPSVPIQIKLWRTIASGTTYFCVDAVDYVSTGGDNTGTLGQTAAIYNTALNPTVTLKDGALDANIETNEEVYDDGGDGTQEGSVVDNNIPPGFQCMIAHGDRFIGISGNDVWPSKQFVTGEGAGFNEVFNFTIDEGLGFITAAASMDANIVLFKRDRIFVMQGQGPTDTGGNNDYTQPQRIAADVGCVDWRSVVVTPQGCYFMSDSGLRLLTRDLQVQPVPFVEDLLALNPAVTSAIIHPTSNRVLWTANTDDITTPRAGIGIAHDYILDAWTSAQYFNASALQQGCVSSIVTNVPNGSHAAVPTYQWLRDDGTVNRESTTTYKDATTYVPILFTTAWVKSGGIEGFDRFRRMLLTWKNNDPHQLIISVGYDYNESFILLATLSAAQMAAMTTPLCQQLFSLPRQRAEAVRFQVQDFPSGSTVTGQGPTIISIGLEYSAYTNRRLARLPSAQRS